MFADPASTGALIGVVVTAILGYLGIRYTARSSRSAQEKATERATEAAAAAAELEKTKVDALSYARARENYDAALATLNGEVQALKNGRAYDREEHDRQIADLRGRVAELEAARREDKATITTLSAYIRALLALLRDNSITYPPPPDLG